MKAIIGLIIIIGIIFPTFIIDKHKSCPLLDGIYVHTAQRKLAICEQGMVTKEFNVALGNKGVGKKQVGDKKTPLGQYAMASPRKSNRFGIFIPIQYPTAQQISAGYTGKDIGIHGPMQVFKGLGYLNTMYDWTLGCIAVGSNQEIEFIANWIKAHPKSKVLID